MTTKLQKLLTPRVLLPFFGIILLLLIFRVVDVESRVQALLEWFEQAGWRGHVLFSVSLAMALVMMIPNTPFELGAGILFSYPVAVAYCVLAETVGSVVAFGLSQRVVRGGFRRRLTDNRQFRVIASMFTHEGWKTVALTRVMPMFPFKASNYAFGLTPLRMRPFAIGTFVGIIPRVMAVVYAGTLLESIAEIGTGRERARTPAEWAILGVLAVLAIGGLITLVWLARRAWRRQVEREANASGQSQSPVSSEQ